MKKLSLILLSLAAIASQTRAHFVFIVPDAGAAKASVILSEDLQADDNVSAAPLAHAALSIRDADGHETVLTVQKGDHSCSTELPGKGPRVVHGVADLGIYQHGNSKPALLLYHPETILGDPFTTRPVAAPIEIHAVGKPGEFKFAVVAADKPAANSDVHVILPDGSQKKVTTDAQGETPVLKIPGRYGAWARSIEATPGQRDGKTYEETRHYATLVIDVPAARYSALPQAVASFGAVGCDGFLYVYGGHVAPTHNYSTAAVSGRFSRLKLDGSPAWEELPGGPAIQGMNLAAHDGKIYRVGGMEPRNKPGQPADNYSLTSAACFDPVQGRWEDLPPLPEGRSSHDIAVVGSKLYVIGGWVMRGAAGGNQWPDTAFVMDLALAKPEWQRLAQPFKRRALIVAVRDQKIYVFGGFDEASEPSDHVDVLNTVSGQWSSGPKLPGKPRNGFAPAACVAGGCIYLSVADGSLYRMNESGKGWQKVASTTPRIVHRLVSWKDTVLVIGGAAAGRNLDLIETVDVTASLTTAVAK